MYNAGEKTKMKEETKLEKLRVLQLMGQSLDSSIDLHRYGFESYDSIMTRCFMLKKYIEILLEEKN